ncbi:hypothetical protein VPH35_058742 [Triticum aestivum]
MQSLCPSLACLPWAMHPAPAGSARLRQQWEGRLFGRMALTTYRRCAKPCCDLAFLCLLSFPNNRPSWPSLLLFINGGHVHIRTIISTIFMNFPYLSYLSDCPVQIMLLKSETSGLISGLRRKDFFRFCSCWKIYVHCRTNHVGTEFIFIVSVQFILRGKVWALN